MQSTRASCCSCFLHSNPPVDHRQDPAPIGIIQQQLTAFSPDSEPLLVRMADVYWAAKVLMRLIAPKGASSPDSAVCDDPYYPEVLALDTAELPGRYLTSLTPNVANFRMRSSTLFEGCSSDHGESDSRVSFIGWHMRSSLFSGEDYFTAITKPEESLDQTRKQLKRTREEDDERPAKRQSRHFEMMSDRHNLSKKYYCGPSLGRRNWNQRTRYNLVKRLGTGGEGTAHLLKSWEGGLVVCKVIPHRKYEECDELYYLKRIPHHDRIVALREAIVSPSQTQLYLDFCSGGDLTGLMDRYHDHVESLLRGHHRPSRQIPESFLWHTLLQLAEALAYIHRGYSRRRKAFEDGWLPIVHRDIKPCNILLHRAPPQPDHPGPEPYPRIVLADFGMAMQAGTPGHEPHSDSLIGTVPWQPPEVPHHSTKGDVWSTGAVVYAMITGDPPLDPLPAHWEPTARNRRKWDAAPQARNPRSVAKVSEALDDCLQGCFTRDPEYRFTAMDLLEDALANEDRVLKDWEALMPWV